MAGRFSSTRFQNLKLGAVITHPAFIFFCACLIAIVGSTALWNHYRPQLVAASGFHFDQQAMDLNENPQWISVDIKDAIWRENKFAELDLLDPELVPRVADAFANNPWVQQVNHVSKHPSGVAVDVVFRQPVALVELAGNKLMPVDQFGTVLDAPTMSNDYAKQCWRIHVIDPAQTSLLSGQIWPDSRITDACLLGQTLSKYRKQYQLDHIAQFATQIEYQTEAKSFILRTDSGVCVVWGSSPNRKTAAEASLQEKIDAIENWIKENKGFAEAAEKDPTRLLVVDVRTGKALTRWLPKDSRLFNFGMHQMNGHVNVARPAGEPRSNNQIDVSRPDR